MAAFGVISRFLGLFREATLASYYGTSAEADAFSNGLWVVNTIAAVLSYTLITLVIPRFQQEEHDHGERSAWGLLGAIAGWVAMVLVVATAIATIWPEGVASLFSLFQTAPESEAILARLIRIMAPAIGLQGMATLFVALLQVRGSFSRPAAIGVAFNVGILIGIFALHSRLGIEAAAWGVVLGAILLMALQFPQFVRFWQAGGGKVGLRHPRLVATAVMGLPVLAATLVQQLNSFSDRLFINLWKLDAGATSGLSYASTLGSAPRTALLFPLLVPLFPHVARLMTEQRHADAHRAFLRAGALLGLVAVPASLILALQADGAAQIIFQRGDCDLGCRENIAPALLFYGFAVWGAFMVYLLNRTLSAAQLPRQIMVATIATVATVVAFDIILIGPLEQAGLAMASMIGVYVNTAIMLTYARRDVPGFAARPFVTQQLRLGLCGIPMAAALLVAEQAVSTTDHGFIVALGLFAAKALLGVVVFAIAARIVAPTELRAGLDTLRSVVRRKRPAKAE